MTNRISNLKLIIGNDFQKTMRKSVSYLWESTQDALEFWTQFLRSEALETLIAVWNDAKPEVKDFIDDFQYVFILYIRGVMRNFDEFSEYFWFMVF